MSDNEQDSADRPFHREGQAVVFDKPRSEEEIARETRDREQHEFARAQVKTNRRLAWFTGALVLATFCTIAIGVWQAEISQKAANAAKSAADAAVTIQRPWLRLSLRLTGVFGNHFPGSDTYQVQVVSTIKNVGTGVATEASIRVMAVGSPWPEPRNARSGAESTAAHLCAACSSAPDRRTESATDSR